MSPATRKRQYRTGFTLTEMLVATGLVVLIMLMFAQIYSVAIGTLREQRGLAQNDQKARIVSNILRSDLQNMTYRQPAYPYGDVLGIVAMSDSDEPIIDPINQRGYFYYGENTTNNDTDDVLQFTMQIASGQRGDIKNRKATRPFVGRAADLGGVDNEPFNDNGSTAAEVSYFLRRGILYRRVLLIRDPLQRRPSRDSQPTQSSNELRYFNSSSRPDYRSVNATESFYNNFDYAATISNDVLWFHSLESLDNTLGTSNVPIARRVNRFGFIPNGANAGDPREFENVNGSGAFIGRFTLGETSHDSFEWPQDSPGTNPYTTNGTLNSEGEITGLDDGDRRGEDILLTNVESFDVKIIDDNLGSFTDVSGGFDSWHPDASGTAPYQDHKLSLNNAPTTWSSGQSGPIRIPVLGNSNDSFGYQVVSTATVGGDDYPEFVPIPGALIADGTEDKVWQCFDNRNGIKAVRITIRFRDITSNIPRQLTIVHSFVE